MSKPAYLLLIAVIAGLAAYAFWPAADQRAPLVALWPGAAPAAYALRAGDATQAVDGATVVVDGVALPLDPERAWRLWNLLGEPAVDAARAARIGERDLAAFGIDGTRALTAGSLRLLWGERDGRATAWRSDDGRALPLDRGLAMRLAQAWARLDAPPVATAGVDAVEVEGLALRRDAAGRWWAADAPDRPEFTTRVGALLSLVADQRVESLAPLPERAGREVRIAAHRLRVAGDGDDGRGGSLAIDAFPPQPLDPAASARWRNLLDAFGRDYLFSPPARRIDDPVEEVVVERGGQPWFRLERRGNQDVVDGRSRWDVLVGGQRLVAAADAAARLEAAFEQVTVAEPRRRADAAPLAPDAVRIALVGQLRGEPMTLELGGGQVASLTHVGRALAVPPALATLGPDACLDLLAVARSPARLDKLQRVFHEDGATRGETFVRGARGWARTFPRAAPVDANAVESLVRAVCGLRAVSARLATPADRALADAATLELACRFAPREAGRASDAAALDETAALEVAFAFAPIAGGWRALDPDAAIVYEFADETVAALTRPLAERALWALAPNLVARILVARAGESYALVRTGESTWAFEAEGGRPPADALAVARWLREVAALTADTADAEAPVLPPEERLGVVTCVMPGFEAGDERLSLHVGHADDGVVTLSSDSTRTGAGGRFRLRVEPDLLLPPRDRFAPR